MNEDHQVPLLWSNYGFRGEASQGKFRASPPAEGFVGHHRNRNGSPSDANPFERVKFPVTPRSYVLEYIVHNTMLLLSS